VWPEAITGTSLAQYCPHCLTLRPRRSWKASGRLAQQKKRNAVARQGPSSTPADDPKKRIPILRNLAQRHRAQIAFLNGMKPAFGQLCGIIQGCPLSGLDKGEGAKLASDKALDKESSRVLADRSGKSSGTPLGNSLRRWRIRSMFQSVTTMIGCVLCQQN